MKIAMGNDHTAIDMKNIIKEFVESKGYQVIDFGTNSTES
ncbi:MAG: RpiB/LacA/LacB family sugar-phosphate isomerase, partial [Lacrimispora sp.]